MKLRIAVTAAVLVPVLASCGGGGSAQQSGFEDAAMACGIAFALDQIIQESATGEPPTGEQLSRVQEMLDEMPAAANRAAQANDRYGQLALLVSTFTNAIDSSDPEAILDLVAVEGECENIAGGPLN